MKSGHRLGRGVARAPAGLAVVLAIVAATTALSLVLLERNTPAVSLLRLPKPVTGVNGWNSGAFVQDNLWTDDTAQYVVWIDSLGRPTVARRAADGSQWSAFDLATIPGNPLAAPTAPDAHNYYVIATDSEGYVHVVGNMKDDPIRYVRSVRPHDITEWVSATMTGSNESAVSYPTFLNDPSGDLLFVFRQGDETADDVFINRWDTASGTWVRQAHLIDGQATDESPYLQHIAVDRQRGFIHVMWTWRRTTDPLTNNDVSYARSRDGGRTWERSDGSALVLPITHETAEIAMATEDSGYSLLNNGGLEVDGAGRPHAAFLVDDQSTRRLLHIWLDGEAWQWRWVEAADGLASRPAVATTSDGSVVAITTLARDGTRTIAVIDLENEGDDAATEIWTIPDHGWEPSFDTQRLYRSGELTFLVTGPDGDNTQISGVLRYLL